MAARSGGNGEIRRRTWDRVRSRFRLSPRELMAVEGMVGGEKLKETCLRLGIGDGSLRTYRQRALSKMRVGSVAEAIIAVVRLDSR